MDDPAEQRAARLMPACSVRASRGGSPRRRGYEARPRQARAVQPRGDCAAPADRRGSPLPRLLLASLLAAACLALPAASRAADAVLVADPAAEQITALNGTVVWVSGAFGSQRLMQRAPDGSIGAVKRAPVARSYGAIDLGL